MSIPSYLGKQSAGVLHLSEMGLGRAHLRLWYFRISVVLIAWLLGSVAFAQTQNVTLVPYIVTVAGANPALYYGDGVLATASGLEDPASVTVDHAGNLYIAEYSPGNRIRVVNMQIVPITVAGVTIQPGYIATVAGNGGGTYVQDNVQATSTPLGSPSAVAVDSVGNIYIAVPVSERIRKVDTNGIITTVAGNGSAGYTGDGGPATLAELYNPNGLTLDSAGSLYIADTWNHVIRKVDAATQNISTIAGGGALCSNPSDGRGDGCPANQAQFLYPTGVALDGQGNVYVADFADNRVRVVNMQSYQISVAGAVIPAGYIAAVAGTGTAGVGVDGIAATTSNLSSPYNCAVDSVGNVYIADFGNNRVRKVDATGTISTVAGNGTGAYGGDGGPATSAEIWGPYDVAFDSAGNLLIADYENALIRKVISGRVLFLNENLGSSESQNVTLSFNTTMSIANVQVTNNDYAPTLNGSCDPSVSAPTMCSWSVQFTPSKPGPRWSAFMVTDGSGNNYNFGLEGTGVGPAVTFRPGTITTVAGNGSCAITDAHGNCFSGDGGLAINAETYAAAIAMDGAGNLYIADSANNRIRMVNAATGVISTIAGTGTYGYNGDGIPAISAELNLPFGVAVDSAGNLYIADDLNSRIRMVSAATGIITTVAGNGSCTIVDAYGDCYSGDGGLATNAELFHPVAVTVDVAGSLYISDSSNQRIRKVDSATGVITTVAGTGFSNPSNGRGGYNGDNIPATSAQLNSPAGVAVDSAGNLYIADYLNARIRKVDVTTGLISTVAGSASPGDTIDNTPATTAMLYAPSAVALDSSGSIYITDYEGYLLKVNAATDIINIVAGAGYCVIGYNGDNILATVAELNYPSGVLVDGAGNLYVADSSNERVRKVTLSTPSSFTFASTNVGSVSVPQDVAVENIGNAQLSITQITSAGNFNTAGADTSCASISQALAPAAGCTLGIEFAPLSMGALAGGIVLADNNLNVSPSVQTINLSGTGVGLNPVFTNLTPSQTITAGTATVTLSGNIGSGTYYPTAGELISITLNGTTYTTPIGANGSFSDAISIATLAPNTYTVTYSYSGDSALNAASDDTTTVLTIISATPPSYPLTISAVGTGSGTVTDNTGQINCVDMAGTISGTCTASYTNGTLVTLSATFSAPSQFLGFSGGCVSTGTCSVNVTGPLNVVADFATQFTPVSLPFNSGTNVTGMATFCPGNASSCPTDTNAQALTLLLPQVSTGFALTVTATEISANGLCPNGATPATNFNCRFINFFDYGTDLNNNTIVPLCVPYANGNCVFYEVYYNTAGTEPNPSWYSGGVFWKVGFNNNSFVPQSYWANINSTPNLPRLLDDPDSNENPNLPYGTNCSTPMLLNGVPTSPAIYCQFDRDITTFYNPAFGLDTTVGGHTKQTNDVVVAFLPTSAGSKPVQQPPTGSAPTISAACVTTGCVLSGTVVTFTVGTGATLAITPTGYPVPVLSESGTLPTGLTLNPITGVIAGTPADGTVGSYPVTLTAINANGTAQQAYSLTVTAAPLTITASNSTMTFGGTVPTITASYSGFVNSDTPAQLTTAPTCTTSATSSSPAGVYPSYCNGAFDANYAINYVNGTVTVSALEISTNGVNFGTLYLGQVAIRPVTLTNTGKTPITISNVAITGPGNATGDYGDITLCTPLITKLPGVLPAGKSCPIIVGAVAAAKIFSPTASTATLAITDSTAGSPHLVALTMQVINPQASLSTSSLTFPAQAVGTTSAAEPVTLTNTGNTPLLLGSLTISGNFSFANGTTCANGGTVAAGASCTINVAFTPTAKGTRTGSIKITDNALVSPQVIALAGTGH